MSYKKTITIYLPHKQEEIKDPGKAIEKVKVRLLGHYYKSKQRRTVIGGRRSRAVFESKITTWEVINQPPNTELQMVCALTQESTAASLNQSFSPSGCISHFHSLFHQPRFPFKYFTWWHKSPRVLPRCGKRIWNFKTFPAVADQGRSF